MCVFCKIIQGEIPSTKIYEDDQVLAILDISQATKGHTLVLPKKHYSNLLEIEQKDYLHVMSVAQNLAKQEVKVLQAEGCNILNNCNEVAGQTVMHFHVHIIPRYQKDDIALEFKDHSKEYDLKEIQKTIVG